MSALAFVLAHSSPSASAWFNRSGRQYERRGPPDADVLSPPSAGASFHFGFIWLSNLYRTFSRVA